MLYGVVSSLIYPLETAWPKVQVRIQPDFAGDLPGGTLNIALGIRFFREFPSHPKWLPRSD
jgi:hypothetical protein